MSKHLEYLRLAVVAGALSFLGISSSSPVYAQLLLNDGENNTVNTFSDSLEVRNGPGGITDPTTLSVETGADIAALNGTSIALLQNSILQMSDGQTAGSINVADDSVANISGGSIGNDVVASGNSHLNLSGGTLDDLFINDSATVVMTGGFLDEPRISGNGSFQFSAGRVDDLIGLVSNSQVELSGTALVDDDAFFAGSLFKMSGGQVDDELWIGTSDGGTTLSTGTKAVFTGGTIGDDLNVLSDAVVDIHDIQLEDNIDARDSGVANVLGGMIKGSVSMLDSSIANISGGEFPNVFSDGEQLEAIGGTVNVTGGMFGQAGVNNGGAALASLGGSLNYSDAQIAGISSGDAPTATFSAVLNGQINLSNSEFGRLKLEANSNGVIIASGYTADAVEVSTIGGGTVNLLGSGAAELDISVELGGIVNLSGGQFGDIDAILRSEGILNVIGQSFTVNNVPLENLDDVFGPGGYDQSTGEIRFVSGLLGGVLANGDSFELSFTRFAVERAQLFVQIVPEPQTCLLAVVAAMAMLVLRRD